MSYKNSLQISKTITVFLVTTVMLLGLFFRLSNLSNKVFWVDEVATAVRVSGYTIAEVTDNLLQQGVVDRKTLLSYQTINSERTFSDSLNALTKSPEHAPLYFLLTRLWVQWWGHSIWIMRSLSIVFSLLCLPCIYWLCQELFKRSPISWLAVGIMSISPFYVAYAQEARPYSLWTVGILLMGASFLRAIRLNTTSTWSIYGLCLILGFYTSLFSSYIAFSQGIYLLLNLTKQRLFIIKNYLISLSISLLAFLPWIWVIINHLDLLQDNTSWMRDNFSVADIIAVYIGTNLLIFGDLPLSPDSNPIQIAIALVIIVIGLLGGTKIYPRWKNKPAKFVFCLLISLTVWLLTKYIYLDWITIIGALVAICILSLSAYSLYYLIIKTHYDRWLYIICMMLALPLPLLLADIVNQGQSSTTPRYLIPWQLGIIIAVAYTLDSKLNNQNYQHHQQPKFWQLTIIAFLLLGIFSDVRNLSLSPFYQKGRNVNNPAIAKIINHHHSTLVMLESTELMDAVSLAYSLIPEVKYKVITLQENLHLYLDEFNDQFDHFFLLKPTKQLTQKLNQDPQIVFQKVYKSPVFSVNEFPLDLWSIKRLM
ncbi:MAG: hypothetical protein RLZZ04_2970 [Cyanobacteriota bacterium]|jgi:uncharacterized membrane protein